MAGLGKRLLAAEATQTLVALLGRFVRHLYRGGVICAHDPTFRQFLASGEPAVFACLHQDFLFSAGYLSTFTRGRPTQVLASASRDGGLMAAAARGAGFKGAVRGSSARGGAGALRSLRRVARERRASIVIVCDGPRPPAFVLKPGAIDVAGDSGLPLWFVRTSFHPQKVLTRTWARFLLPSPIGRAVVRAEGPIHVPPGLDRAGREALRQELEGRLLALARRSDEEVARR